MARVLDTQAVVPVIRDLLIKACCDLDDNLMSAFRNGLSREESPLGKEIFETLIENAEMARNQQIPSCQDTGAAIVYLQIGQEVSWTGQPLGDMIDEGVRKGYGDGYLRKSMLHPITRVNSNDNTPAIVHTEIVPGDRVHIAVLPKGGGSENMSRLAMLVPAVGIEGVKDFVLETVVLAGGKSCPPLVVGVGIGGTMDSVCWNAKKSLLRPIGDRHPDPDMAALEAELLERINNTGIGPLGMGGRVTALDVHVATDHCHITSLPVAVNIQCHACRHAAAVL